MGLSPRVRGNPAVSLTWLRWAGSIPACAGEPHSGLCWAPASGVYPRVCGGTWPSGPQLWPSAGLSPRVRGNPFAPIPTARARRSIPACAGEPAPWRIWWPSMAVYPRVCGGTSSTQPSWETPSGLSPRVRGNRPCSTASPAAGRSIPACAGEPQGRLAQNLHRRVYPRVCGGTRP